MIADDVTGAAELAAAAADRGLSAEVHTSFRPESRAEVIAVDSRTRSMSAADAARVVGDVARDVLRARPGWLYKKTDSVLRGNVRAEIAALLAATGMTRAILVPANPSKGRVIVGGVYYVGGVPLNQTAFANDPEHPRNSSRVADLLGDPASGPAIDVPDVRGIEDLDRGAAGLEATTLPAGGVEFFQAVLRARLAGSEPAARGSDDPCCSAPASGRRQLFVCGSMQAWRQGRRADCDRRGVPVLTMPEALFATPDAPPPHDLKKWADAVTTAVSAGGRAMVAIGRDVQVAGSRPAALSSTLVATAARVLRRGGVDRVCVEGGATAAALLDAMGWTRLVAVPCHAPGVAVLRPHGAIAPTLLVKPGSYPWPDEVWPDGCDAGERSRG